MFRKWFSFLISFRSFVFSLVFVCMNRISHWIQFCCLFFIFSAWTSFVKSFLHSFFILFYMIIFFSVCFVFFFFLRLEVTSVDCWFRYVKFDTLQLQLRNAHHVCVILCFVSFYFCFFAVFLSMLEFFSLFSLPFFSLFFFSSKRFCSFQFLRLLFSGDGFFFFFTAIWLRAMSF